MLEERVHKAHRVAKGVTLVVVSVATKVVLDMIKLCLEAEAEAGEDLGVADVVEDGSWLLSEATPLNFHRPKLMGFVDLLMGGPGVGAYCR
jgi:hypothetical protein